ncbi:MAG: superoxide dismutase [Aquificota bacterium]|nr:MAG: superoxide dismutase [Aquificota bacterium]
MKKLVLSAVIATSFLFYKGASAHCEVPCGIYNDEMRIHQLQEYILTIEKSMRAIQELSKGLSDPLTLNQVVRWIDNKEKHAKLIQKIVWQYFFTQRVKPVDPKDKEKYKKYLKELELLNKLSFYAMKAKQSISLDVVEKLRETLEAFEEIYFGKEHIEEHHKKHKE